MFHSERQRKKELSKSLQVFSRIVLCYSLCGLICFYCIQSEGVRFEKLIQSQSIGPHAVISEACIPSWWISLQRVIKNAHVIIMHKSFVVLYPNGNLVCRASKVRISSSQVLVVSLSIDRPQWSFDFFFSLNTTKVRFTSRQTFTIRIYELTNKKGCIYF